MCFQDDSEEIYTRQISQALFKLFIAVQIHTQSFSISYDKLCSHDLAEHCRNSGFPSLSLEMPNQVTNFSGTH